jgi:NhaA family Na+:H+ antiporter
LARFSRKSLRTFTFLQFLRTEAAGGILLLLAIAVALGLASSPAGGTYSSFWSKEVFGGGGGLPSLDLRAVVNEGLMTLFFFLVSLEIRRELRSGELGDRSRAMLPVAGAIGGIVVPALIYLLLNSGSGAARGWAIPTATDIAFVAGALALASASVPHSIKVFLVALAIVDDIAAILIIAAFYSHGLVVPALVLALVSVVLLIAIGRGNLPGYAFALVGTVLWAALLAGGIHPTIAGVIVAAVIPFDKVRSEDALNKVSSLAIIPLFALANAGLDLTGISISSVVDSRIALGITLGLLLGKPLGIAAGVAVAVRVRAARLPTGVGWAQMAGAFCLGGIGFTVSLFIAGLAFGDQGSADATIGIFLGSLLSFAVGVWLLQRAK